MQTTNNILYLSYDGLTDPLGQSQILPYITGLSAHYTFTIISFEKPDRFKKSEQIIRRQLEPYRVHWYPLVYHKSPPVFSTVYDLYTLQVLVKRLHRQKPFDCIHCRSYLTALIGLRMKRKYQVKFIFDMRGFWADERVEGGLWNLRNPLFKSIYDYFKKKEKEFLRYADHTISLTENARSEILSRGIKMNAITVIPTCVDLDFFSSRVSVEKQERLRTALGIRKEDPVLLYLGSWGTWYLTAEMTAYFQKLKEVVPNLVFLIVSQDTVVLPDGLKDVRIAKASRDEVPDYLGLAWASIFFIMPTFSKKASSATKLGEILSCGVPVISNSGWGDIDRYSSIYTNLVVKEDPMAFETVKKWFQQNPVRVYNNLYELSLTYGVDQYKKVYGSILSK